MVLLLNHSSLKTEDTVLAVLLQSKGKRVQNMTPVVAQYCLTFLMRRSCYCAGSDQTDLACDEWNYIILSSDLICDSKLPARNRRGHTSYLLLHFCGELPRPKGQPITLKLLLAPSMR